MALRVNRKRLWYPVPIEVNERGVPRTEPANRAKEWGTGVNNHLGRSIGNWQSDHAVDLFRRAKTPVYAIFDGVVSSSAGFGYTEPNTVSPTIYGRRFTLETQIGNFYYAHLDKKIAPKLRQGGRVKAGDLIGWLDPYGSVHLHIGFNGEERYGDKYLIEPLLRWAYTNTGGLLQRASSTNPYLGGLGPNRKSRSTIRLTGPWNER